MSRERPILFSGPMVRAILDGRKTQTRRLVTTRHPLDYIGPSGDEANPDNWGWFFDGPDQHGYMVLGRGHDDRHDHGRISIPCPYGQPGDRLWVRETWACLGPALRENLFYRADRKDDDLPIGRQWRPSIHMPRWASRITLEITGVRVDRLQDISEDDALSEGVRPHDAAIVYNGSTRRPGLSMTARGAFACLWDQINGKRRNTEGGHTPTTFRWVDNPWVWAITFKRIPAEEASKV